MTGKVTVVQWKRQLRLEGRVVRHSLLVLAVFVLLSPTLRAQNVSAGASYTLLSLTYPDQIPQGFGGWLTWDFIARGPSLGLDLGVNFFPENHPIIGRQTQVMGGLRGGIRADRVGAFGRVRPGFLNFSERFGAPDTVCIQIFPIPESCLIKSSNFALDLGGTLEFYPGSRTTIRVDIGDTRLRFGRTGQDAVWKDNLQFAAGAGVRF